MTALSPLRRTGVLITGTALITCTCLAGAASVAAAAGSARPANSGAVKIMSDASDEGSFGISLDLTPDGTTAIVGAQQHNGNRGGAYLFQYADGSWTKVGDLTKSQLAYGDSYGNAVAIDQTAQWALVGDVGWHSLTGRVFALHKTKTHWKVVSRLKAPHGGATYTHFGDSLSMDAGGDTAVIGELGAVGFEGRAYVVTRQSDGTWKRTAQLSPHTTDQTDFGQFVAMSADGSTIVVGANTAQSALGAAYVFHRTGDRWRRVALLSGQVDGGNFGNTVAVDDDGGVVAVGAVYEGTGGAAYVYERGSDGSYAQTAHLTVDGSGQFGSSVGLDAAGDTVVVGAQMTDTAGTASVFTNDGSGWTLADTLTPTVTDQALFGVATSVDAAGDLAVVGAAFDDGGVAGQNGYGAAYIEPLP